MRSYGRQSISDVDIDAVVNALRSDFLTQGPAVTLFEQALSDYTGANYGVAVNSATSALHIACLALGVAPGDQVWTVANTFVASANCARMCGAVVDLVDIDASTGNLCISSLETKLEQAELTGHLPKVLIPVHFAGQSCDMEEVNRLAKKFKFHVIEDASHALGGSYKRSKIGCCRYSDITVFSFHPVKMITTAEGGMAVTNNEELAHRMRNYASHGIERTPLSAEEPWSYSQTDLGYNYRMPDICAALGQSQLQQLDSWVERRNMLATRYSETFTASSVQPLTVSEHNLCSYHIYVVKVPPKQRLRIFNTLKAEGIGVQIHYVPVYKQPFYKSSFNGPSFSLEQTENYYASCLTLPLYPSLSEHEQDTIINKLLNVLNSN
ncbi:UDP-4-amino-4,6-dideoxy-N-acetyl-beta-L-altrosamine transaminase [Pseudoalteromonas sp. Cnat2-41]|uniref:UDP-4-amino-4, 6-dideoxy-N-acetyl-beta-L-altrosamine transaminase n=1 Tax=unclassified Pseudoalteromonas TaxID=194690 RepID=UPI001EF948C5|nr:MULTISPECIES: UDP-4-amino-4,6-dideoxy-N-acetyl-beta-L-altrosamine transaminase [unclassified Pseudoalteromonas]MCF2863462.1 UDP-4-amino-4,6-dideoxy-N-acetyl-beta-L-altrosamine transaminase [Pseudoalteromonas sp. CNAT2-18]MCG7558415.1 UDP-4-amino-4,6-dideoxy-N-acetyl-beta-L-altrosamine transaminase [Pseudoalteromonas sp. CNAT2-18.1]